ncbi:MAG: cation transporter [Rhodospirillales bacterium 20-64-7]|nr:MAG: cation transporter [Rhodospirillales bacterium 20-64-7]HQT76706.1 CDF family Co(II)/Ni(II) efflux transporter DmeF [Rhodopila sp.]
MEPHSHIFLGEGHELAERRTWGVIWLCSAMMALEIVGGLLFGSIALVADGLHMSTHAGALLLAALAYRYARRHATDPRFTFGTGKLGDLAGFTSAIVLAMIAVLIGWEAVTRFMEPVPIHFAEAIPIACLGLVVNIASAWLLSGGHHHHHHGHDHGHDHHGHNHHDAETRIMDLGGVQLMLEIFEDGVPPRFRIHAPLAAQGIWLETHRPDGTSQRFSFIDRGTMLESNEEIPEPHEFTVHLHHGDASASSVFAEHAHGATDHDNNMRAAIVHVVADAAVSVLVILGLVLARGFGWIWMDPLAGIVGACVIASWAYGLVRDTGRILLDMNPDRQLTERLRQEIETNGDRLTDLHIWRLGPGHLGAVLSVVTAGNHRPEDYRQRLRHYTMLSHVTVEVHPQ